MTTQSFLDADPFAVLNIPRCIKIARGQMDHMSEKQATKILPLIWAAEVAEGNWINGASYTIDEAAYHARVKAMNDAGTALLNAVGAEYT